MAIRAVRVCSRTRPPLLTSGRANRWNASGQHVLYLAEHFATAVLESVVHASTVAPPPAHAQWVTIPDDVRVLQLDTGSLPAGWDEPDDQSVARAQGAAWVAAGASACLMVPSVPGRPYERNIVVSTSHPDYAKLVWDSPEDVPWDPRLFA